jgi:acetyltransferase-like isoleucine patch superfamily enzyme
MNAHYWFQRLLLRTPCELGVGAQLRMSARIFNARGGSQHIRIGDHSIIRGELMVFGHGGQLDIGEWCYVGEGTRIWSAASVFIGDRVLISHNVNIFDNLTHPLSASARHNQFVAISTIGHPRDLSLSERPVVIGSDSLISAAATVLRGVTIGVGAIVGAGAVVTKDVPPFCIAVGNPARVIRELTQGER